MEATRVRIGSILEWILAAACALAVLALGAAAVRELRSLKAVTPVTPVIAEERVNPEAPLTVPPGAVSVPMLLLSNGVTLHIGETARDIEARVLSAWQVGRDAVERTARGRRIARAYDDGATQFTLVFETDAPEPRQMDMHVRTAPRSPGRLAGIFLRSGPGAR